MKTYDLSDVFGLIENFLKDRNDFYALPLMLNGRLFITFISYDKDKEKFVIGITNKNGEYIIVDELNTKDKDTLIAQLLNFALDLKHYSDKSGVYILNKFNKALIVDILNKISIEATVYGEINIDNDYIVISDNKERKITIINRKNRNIKQIPSKFKSSDNIESDLFYLGSKNNIFIFEESAVKNSNYFDRKKYITLIDENGNIIDKFAIGLSSYFIKIKEGQRYIDMFDEYNNLFFFDLETFKTIIIEDAIPKDLASPNSACYHKNNLLLTINVKEDKYTLNIINLETLERYKLDISEFVKNRFDSEVVSEGGIKHIFNSISIVSDKKSKKQYIVFRESFVTNEKGEVIFKLNRNERVLDIIDGKLFISKKNLEGRNKVHIDLISVDLNNNNKTEQIVSDCVEKDVLGEIYKFPFFVYSVDKNKVNIINVISNYSEKMHFLGLHRYFDEVISDTSKFLSNDEYTIVSSKLANGKYFFAYNAKTGKYIETVNDRSLENISAQIVEQPFSVVMMAPLENSLLRIGILTNEKISIKDVDEYIKTLAKKLIKLGIKNAAFVHVGKKGALQTRAFIYDGKLFNIGIENNISHIFISEGLLTYRKNTENNKNDFANIIIDINNRKILLKDDLLKTKIKLEKIGRNEKSEKPIAKQLN